MGEQLALHGNHASRCGGQAVLLYDPRLTDKVRRGRFLPTNPEDRVTEKRLLVPGSTAAIAAVKHISVSTLSKLTGKPSRAFHG